MARSHVFSFRRWLTGLGLCCAVAAGCAGPKVAQNDTSGGFPNPFPAAPPSHANTAQYQPPEPEIVEDTGPEKASAQLHLAYGHLQEQRGDAAAARVSYLKAIETDSKCVDAHVGLARLDLGVGRQKDAEKHLFDALKEVPDSPFALAALGQFHGDQGNWGQALDYYKQAMNVARDDKRYAFQYAVALAKSGQVEESRVFFTRSVGDAAGHHNIAVILQEQGDLDGAAIEAQLALTKDPQLTASRELLASITGGEPATDNGPAIRPGRAKMRGQVQQVSGTRPVRSTANSATLNISTNQPEPLPAAPPVRTASKWDDRPHEEDDEWQKMPTVPRNPLEQR